MAGRDVGGAGSARRLRERRLSSMLRHERQTVAMELAAALHHSRDVGPEQHDALREHKTASSGGERPGVLKDPEPPWVEAVTVGYEAAGAPLLEVPTLRGDDGVDGTTVSWLLKVALKKKEEERRRKLEEKEEEGDKKAMESQERARLFLERSERSVRNRKKKMKRLPRTSSFACAGRPWKSGHSSTSPSVLAVPVLCLGVAYACLGRQWIPAHASAGGFSAIPGFPRGDGPRILGRFSSLLGVVWVSWSGVMRGFHLHRSHRLLHLHHHLHQVFWLTSVCFLTFLLRPERPTSADVARDAHVVGCSAWRRRVAET